MRSNGKSVNQVVVVDGRPLVARQVDRTTAMEIGEMFVVRNLPKYLKRLHALAMGVRVAKEVAPGNLKVYTEPPNFQALTYLVDRGLGRIPQRHEVTGQDGGPMEVIPWRPRGVVFEGEVVDAVQEIPQPSSEPDLESVEQGEDEEGESGQAGTAARGKARP